MFEDDPTILLIIGNTIHDGRKGILDNGAVIIETLKLRCGSEHSDGFTISN